MSDKQNDPIDTLLREHFDGAVPDDGFCERVLQRLPPRRRSRSWLLPVAILTGAGTCWLSLLSTPWISIGWRDWARGELSTAAVGMLLAIGGMSLLASLWAVMEADDR